MGGVTLTEAQSVLSRYKFLATDMLWTSKRAGLNGGWLSTRMSVQFADEFEVSDEVYLMCQWREKAKAVPEFWTFSLFFKDARIYAIDVQPTHLHQNKVGKGRRFWGQEVGGIHEHLWSDDGYGYAEPIEIQLSRPDVIWRMFLKRANFQDCDFSHPDQNQPGLVGI